MRGFSIFVWCLVTALMFYSAWRFKAPEIETDIMARVSDGVTKAGGSDVAIEVDGRHVNLRGYAVTDAQKSEFLDTADSTYGALGPIDGLMRPKAPARTFLSAARKDNSVILSGVVGSTAERDMLLNQAKEAGLGNVMDDLTVADGQIGWSANAQAGFAQLADLESGHLYVSDTRNTLSGNAPTVDVATAANSLGDGWNAFVAGPALEDPRIKTLEGEITARDTQLADLNAQIGDRDGQITALNSDLEGVRNDLTVSQTQMAGLHSVLKQRKAHITLLTRDAKSKSLTLAGATQTADAQAARITALETELSKGAAREGELADKMAEMTASLDLLRKDGGSESANLEAALAEKTADVTELEAELVALSKSKDRTIADLNTTIADLSAQKAEADQTLTSTNQANAAELADQKAEITVLKTDLDTMTGTLSKTNEARVAALNQSKDLEAQLAAKATQTTELNARLAEQTSQTENLNAKLVEQTTQAEDLNAKLAEQSTQVSAMSQEVDTLKGQLSDFEVAQTKLGQLETTVTEKDAKIASLMIDLQNQPTEPEVQTVAQCNDTATALLAEGKINFVTNSADIVEDSEPLLERITGVVLACSRPDTDASVTVAGHTDDRGSEGSNQVLSEARAQSVARFMTERGVDPKALQPVGFGESQPIADNETSEGRAENRRISFEFQAR